MRLGSRSVARAGLGLWIVFACGCKGGSSGPATRADCAKVAEHIAELVFEEAKANPDALWDAVHVNGEDPGIPSAVTKTMFKTWIERGEGQTWMMQRRGQTLAATQLGIDSCVANATKAQVKCLLDASSKKAVDACDLARTPANARPAPGDGSGGSADGSANGSADGGADGSSGSAGSAIP